MSTSPEQLLSENIIPQGIEHEIKQSYISYAMSVIVSRALPDVRDGFKPVLRRILYAMYDMKLTHTAKFKKSAFVVGEVMGKYHPHGDSSIYDALARLAQEFSLRYPLIDGQGNFGSIDGDAPAAMRYTEARLTKLAEEMLEDIELDTIDVQSNYDSSRTEPVMLPTKFPNHLCNGTMGIAVGMATNMAPHNLGEVIDASLLVLDNYEASVDEIMEHIKGPDFPTGGIIFNPLNIKEVYRTGHGGIVVRGKAHIEDSKHGKQIVITEIPYQVNKSSLVAKFGELVSDKRLEGISDITDASSRDAINIIITLKKGVNADDVLALLYKSTDLQTNFNLNNIALIDKGIQPQLLNIRDLVVQFVDFRRTVVYRRSVFLLKKAKDRLHILEGLKKAIDMIDQIIETIKSSATRTEAKERLMKEFDFTEVQTEYILQMRLQSLVGLEIQNVLEEIDEKTKQIQTLEEIISDSKVLDNVVRTELLELKNKYADPRRTEVSSDESVYTLGSQLKALRAQQDKIKESVILRVGNDHSFRVLYQSRINQIPDDSLDVIYTNNQDELIVITDRGELVIERLKDIGQHQMKSPALSAKEHRKLQGNVVFVNTMEHAYDYLIFLTDNNNLKKIKKELLLKFKKFPTIVMNLDEGERLMSVEAVTQGDKVGIISQQGMLLIFPEDQIRPSGKGAGGVKGIDLQASDQVAKLFLYRDEPFIMLYSDQSAKLINTEDCKIWKRARVGQMALDTRYGEPLKGAISIVEGAVRVRLMTGNIITLHSNDIDLDDLETPLRKIVNGNIDLIYRPWEEKEENKRFDKSDTQSENVGPSQPELLS